MDIAERTDWVRCPKCGSKTRTLVREHTILEDFPPVLSEMSLRMCDCIQKWENRKNVNARR